MEAARIASAADLKQKANFLNLTFTDGLLFVHVLQSVDEFYEEGKEMQHCVFSNAYYNKEYSLILSATINGKRIETIEVSLKTFQIVQSRGLCNANTEYHDRTENAEAGKRFGFQSVLVKTNHLEEHQEWQEINKNIKE